MSRYRSTSKAVRWGVIVLAAAFLGGLGAVVLFVAGAFATVPPATTQAATNVTTSGATLNGTITDGTHTASTVEFCYKATTFTTCATATTLVEATPPTLSASTSPQAVSAAVTGLDPKTTYYFRVEAVITGSTVQGSTLSFTTSAEAPTATTSAATGTTATGATLHGSVDDENNTSTAVSFCYSISTSLATCTGATTVTATPPSVTGHASTSVSASLTGLEPNTTYYFQVKAVSAGTAFTSYGSVLSFTTSHTAPTATTSAATSLSATGATLNGSVNDENNTSTAVSFCYKTTSFSDCAGATSVTATPSSATGAGATPESATLSGLTPNTPYYFQVKAVSTGETSTVYGSVLSFTTPHLPPTATTSAATGVSATAATLNGSVNDETNTSTAVTFCYSTSPSLATCGGATTVAGSATPVTGHTTRAETAALTGLIPNTTYYFQVKAVSTGDAYTVYGSVLHFTTTHTAPTATTSAATDVTTTGATLNGSVNDENNTSAAVTFCYSTSPSLSSCGGATSVTATPPSPTGHTATSVSAVLAGLTPNTKYYFQVKVVSTGGTYTVYGSVLNFMTPHGAPAATTSAATSLSATAATLNGSVNNENNMSTAVTFCYSTSPSLSSCGGATTAAGSTSPVNGHATTLETAALTGLVPNTTYYFQVKAVSTGTPFTTYGSVLSFTTTQTAPTATTSAATSLSATGATLNGSVNDENNTSSAVSFCYSTSPSLTSCGGAATVAASSTPVTGHTGTAETSVLTGLTPNTTYYFQVKAASTGGTYTVYGSVLNFTTTHTAPVATTTAATAVTATGATLNGMVNDENNTSSTVTFCYKTSSFSNCTGATSVAGTPTSATGHTGTTETAVLAGLIPNTTYFFQVKAVSSGAAFTSYGTVKTFTTPHAIPTAVTTSATSVSSTDATLKGTVNNEYNTSTAVTFCYSTSTTLATCGGATTVAGTPSSVTGHSNTPVSAALTGLTPSTKYYFQVKAVATGTVTVYGSVLNFTTTSRAPAATTSAATGISVTGATLNGSVNDENNNSTAVSFCYSTSPSLATCVGATTVTATPSAVTGTTSTAVTAVLTGLLPNTTYYFQVKAVSTGTSFISYGSPLHFTTTHMAPTAGTAAATGVTATGATLNGSVNDENNTSTAVSFCYSTSPSLTACGGATTVAATPSSLTGHTSTAVSAVLTGLVPNTIYYFQVKAVSTGASATSYGAVDTFTTLHGGPTVTTSAASGVSTSSATLNGSVNDENNTSTTVSFCYSTSPSLATCGGATTLAGSSTPLTGHATTPETASLTGLIPNTTYYFQVEADSTGTTFTAYGSVLSFTTTHKAPITATSAATSVSATGVTLNGSVNDENNTSTAVSFCYSTSSSLASCGGATTVAATPSSVTGTTTTTETAVVRGLTPNTTYYFQAKAVSTGGSFTIYGSVLSFTTTHQAPMATTSAATSISATGATLNATVNDRNNTSTAVSFCYSTSTTLATCAGGTAVTASPSSVTGHANTAESVVLTGLTPNTTYYFRVKAVSTGNTYTVYGFVETFTTTHVRPTATTSAATGVSTSSATLNGAVNDENNTSTATSFCYSTSASLATCGSATTVAASSTPLTGHATVVESAALTGLTPNTTYYFQVKAVSVGNTYTVYGSVLSFTTPHVGPIATTVAATPVSATGATLKGTANDENNTSTAVSFCYSTSSSLATCGGATTVAASVTPLTGHTATSETATLTGLVPNTTYYFQVKAVSTGETSTVYGSVLSFTTPHEGPSATTSAATSLSATGATLKGSVNNENNTSTAVTFCYSTSSSLASCTGATTVTATPVSVTGHTATTVSAPLTGLVPNTTYYFQVEAVSTGTAATSYGSVLSFTTTHTAPVAMTTAATGVTTSGATLNGSVNDENNTSTTVSFCYSTSPSLTFCGGATTVAATPASVTGVAGAAEIATISGLTPNTTYYFQVKAVSTGAAFTSYGSVLSFTTTYVPPTATTSAATAVMAGSATLNGTVNDKNNTSTAVSFCYSTSSSLATCGGATTVAASATPLTGHTATAETASVTGLSPNTTYYFQVKAVSTGGAYTVFGSVLSFATPRAGAVATTTAATSVSATGATLNGTVNNENNSSTTVSFCYSTSSSLTKCGSATIAAASVPTVTGHTNTHETTVLTGLLPNTTYYFELKAVTTGTAVLYGQVKNFTTTHAAPVATTSAATPVSQTGATLKGSVNDEDNTSTAVSFCYGTSPGLTACGGATAVTASSTPVTGHSTTAETAVLTGLTPNTTYYFQVRAVSVGTTFTSYGQVKSFTTTVAGLSVTITGSMTFGTTSSERFVSTPATTPPTVTYVTTGLACTVVSTGGGEAIGTHLPAGTYTLKGSTCSGITLSGPQASSYAIATPYIGSTFTVHKGTIAVTVTGSMTYGTTASEHFTPSYTLPHTVTLVGTLTCTKATSATISATTTAGNHKLTGSNCSGLSLGTADASDYTLTYTGSTLTVHKATIATAVSLNTVTPETSASPETFSGTVTGTGALTGTVTVKTTTGTTLCSSAVSGSGSATFSCHQATPIAPKGYTVVAVFSGGTSTTGNYTYASSTSATQALTVTGSTPSSPTSPSAPKAPTPPAGTTSHQSCSVASGQCSAANKTVVATSTGVGAITVAKYPSDPVGSPAFKASGEYFDVKVASTSTFSRVSVKVCSLNGGANLHWWNATTLAWETVTPVAGPSGTPPCLTATLSSSSSPTISQLTGTVFAVGAASTTGAARVAGSTADATAALELERAFAFADGTCPASRAVVLATTKTYQDALSSQVLAQWLTTGTLLTPSARLAPATAEALKDEGISTVYVVGGPLAVSTSVVKSIEALTAFGCDATTPAGKIKVVRIAGATAYATAEAIAEKVGTAGLLDVAGAYSTTNAAGGTGRYNDTSAKGSAAPSGAVPTAILASGAEFQDAQAASVISYRTKLPLLLTPATSLSATTVAAIEALGIKQVILMGGPLAVTDTVEAALVQATGVSVLRIAGKDATDTAVELARFETARSTAGLGWTPGHRLLVARSNGFTDGLAGAVLENGHNSATGASGSAWPLLLTESPTAIGAYLATFLKTTAHAGIDGTGAKTVSLLTVLGGPLAVSTAELSAMETDLQI